MFLNHRVNVSGAGVTNANGVYISDGTTNEEPPIFRHTERKNWTIQLLCGQWSICQTVFEQIPNRARAREGADQGPGSRPEWAGVCLQKQFETGPLTKAKARAFFQRLGKLVLDPVFSKDHYISKDARYHPRTN